MSESPLNAFVHAGARDAETGIPVHRSLLNKPKVRNMFVAQSSHEGPVPGASANLVTRFARDRRNLVEMTGGTPVERVATLCVHNLPPGRCRECLFENRRRGTNSLFATRSIEPRQLRNQRYSRGFDPDNPQYDFSMERFGQSSGDIGP